MTGTHKRQDPPNKNIRVLVVDDEPGIRGMLEKMLTFSGYNVVAAANGPEALELISTLPIGVAIIDKNMPKMTGIEVLRRGREMVPLLQAIVLTGHPDLDSAVDSLRQGAFDYLEKPVHVDLLIEKVSRAMDAFQLNAEREAMFERHETLFELIPGISWFLTERGVFKRINNEGARMLGYQPDELLGHSYEELLIPTSDDDAHWAFKERRTGERATRGKVIEVKTKSGETKLLELYSAGAYFPRRPKSRTETTAECYWGTVGVAVDITKQAAEQQEQQHAQKMAALGRLAGGVAHDFNNLLAVIMSSVFLLRKHLDHESPAVVDLAELEEACSRGSDLTRRLLTFSRKEPYSPKVVDLAAIVRQTEKMISRLLGEHIVLRIRCADDVGASRADPRQIEQVVVNLCVNARDAMPDGGQLTIHVSNVVLDGAYAAIYEDVTPGRYTMIAVSDDGQGMSPEIRHRMFEPFFTTKAEGSGTGLGLATVFGIVRQHKGHLSVYSEQGAGTTVKVYVPQVEEPLSTQLPVPLTESPGGTEHVLLVENDEALRRSMARILRSHGYQVSEAPDAETALALVHSQAPFDLLFTDRILPKMNGDSLARCVRDEHPQVKVVLTSGYLGETVTGSVHLEDGAVFMPKPIAICNLLQSIRDLLDS